MHCISYLGDRTAFVYLTIQRCQMPKLVWYSSDRSLPAHSYLRVLLDAANLDRLEPDTRFGVTSLLLREAGRKARDRLLLHVGGSPYAQRTVLSSVARSDVSLAIRLIRSSDLARHYLTVRGGFPRYLTLLPSRGCMVLYGTRISVVSTLTRPRLRKRMPCSQTPTACPAWLKGLRRFPSSLS